MAFCMFAVALPAMMSGAIVLQYEGGLNKGEQNDQGNAYLKNLQFDYIVGWYEGDLKNGEKHGVGKEYDDKDQVRYDGGWENGTRNGEGKAFDQDGTIWYEGGWKNDTRSGEGSEYAADGSLIYTGGWENDKKNGEGSEYNECQQVSYDGNWKNGEKNGLGTEYHDNGQVRYDGDWENGKRNGKGQEYNEDGQLSYDGYWKSGEKIDEGSDLDLGNSDKSFMTLSDKSFMTFNDERDRVQTGRAVCIMQIMKETNWDKTALQMAFKAQMDRELSDGEVQTFLDKCEHEVVQLRSNMDGALPEEEMNQFVTSAIIAAIDDVVQKKDGVKQVANEFFEIETEKKQEPKGQTEQARYIMQTMTEKNPDKSAHQTAFKEGKGWELSDKEVHAFLDKYGLFSGGEINDVATMATIDDSRTQKDDMKQAADDLFQMPTEKKQEPKEQTKEVKTVQIMVAANRNQSAPQQAFSGPERTS